MIATFFLAIFVALILMGLLAPFETLGWWGGWFGNNIEEEFSETALQAKAAPTSNAQQFMVYLTGIGGTSATEYSPLETRLLAELKISLPEVQIVDDVFPYSSGNRALTGSRVFAWFWRFLRDVKGHGRFGMIGFLINIRNLWQVLVSSDRRFGPVYNTASTQMIYKKLLEHGYPVHSGIPITLLGYSGGGQISTGAAPLLEQAIRAPVHVISLGGVMSSSQYLYKLYSLTHLYGSKDSTQRLGYILFPARWPFFPWTAWNKARQAGIIQRILIGPMVHTGPKGYLDPETKLEDGQSFLTKTTTVITDIVKRQLSDSTIT